MINCYCISGLGADERVFQYLTFIDEVKFTYLSWLSPATDETIEDYSVRMGEKIDQSQPFFLLGLSMGGMIAIEIAKVKKPVKLFLISSITCAAEIPALYRFSAKYKLYKMLSPKLMKNLSILKKWFATYKPEHRNLLINVIRDADDKFVNWAIPALVQWKNTEQPTNYVHIHGTNDNVLPNSCTHPTHEINSGRHFMIVEKAAEISEILASEMSAAIS